MRSDPGRRYSYLYGGSMALVSLKKLLLGGLLLCHLGYGRSFDFGEVIDLRTKTTSFTYEGRDTLDVRKKYTFTHVNIAPKELLGRSSHVYFDQNLSAVYRHPNNKHYVIFETNKNKNNLSLLCLEDQKAIVVNDMKTRTIDSEHCLDAERGILFVRTRQEIDGTGSRFEDCDADVIFAINIKQLISDIDANPSWKTPASFPEEIKYITQLALLPTVCKISDETEQTSDHALGKGCSDSTGESSSSAECVIRDSKHHKNRTDNVGKGMVYDALRKHVIVGATDATRREKSPHSSLLYRIDVSEAIDFTQEHSAKSVTRVFKRPIIDDCYMKHLMLNPWDNNVLAIDNYAGKENRHYMAKGVQYNTLASKYDSLAPSTLSIIDFTRSERKPQFVHIHHIRNKTCTNIAYGHQSFIAKNEIHTSLTGKYETDDGSDTLGYGALMVIDTSYRKSQEDLFWMPALDTFFYAKDIPDKKNRMVEPWHAAMSPDRRFIISDFKYRADDDNVSLHLWYMTIDGKMHCVEVTNKAGTCTPHISPQVHPHSVFINDTTFVYMYGESYESRKTTKTKNGKDSTIYKGHIREKNLYACTIPPAIRKQTIIPMAGAPLDFPLVRVPARVSKGVPFSLLVSPVEITEAEYHWVMGYDGDLIYEKKHDYRPKTDVSWYDVIRYCNKRSEMEGLEKVYKEESNADRSYPELTGEADFSANGYRLPTKEEWLYLFEGTYTRDITRYAVHAAEDKQYVASLHANPKGLYDMAGNVWEWTNSEEGGRGVLLGGAWNRSKAQLKGRGTSYPCDTLLRKRDSKSKYRGFRVVRNAPVEKALQ